MDQKTGGSISMQAFQRMPYYLEYLRELESNGASTVSASNVAAYFHYTEIQVRKDFAAVCSSQGKPRQGFEVRMLINDIETVLGYRGANEAVLAGAGSLGRALLSYGGFHEYGLHIGAAFDTDPRLIGMEVGGIPILSAEEIVPYCRKRHTPIGIITVPATAAQGVCDQFIEGGIRAVWNFSPVYLHVPEGILLQNENMAASLALLSKHLREQMRKGEQEEV